MKKLLLLTTVALGMSCANAQVYTNQLSPNTASLNKPAVSRSSNTSFNKFASSSKAYALYHSQSICASGNPGLALMVFANLSLVSNLSNNGNLGWISTSFSTDGGFTWDTTLVPMHVGSKTTDTGCRYPSGIIFNPIGNTIANHAYMVVSGPYTNNVNWTGYYFGSSRLDGTNDNEQIFPIADTTTTTFNESWPNVATTVAGNNIFVLGIEQTVSLNTISPSGLFKGIVINKGTFDTSLKAFFWTQTKIHIPIAIKPWDLLNSSSIDTEQDILSPFSCNMAWSVGGDIGYVCEFGVDSTQVASAGAAGFFPIVYKSTDSGKTWTKLPYYAFDNNPLLTAHLIPSIDGKKIPFIGDVNGSKLIVDNTGNLHIVTDIESAYSNNTDSLTLYFTPQNPITTIMPQYIYDLSTSDGTTWNAIFVDSVKSQAGNSPLWNSVKSPVIVTARIQASSTSDHSKVFIQWLDSDPTLDGYNDYPNIYGKGIDYTDDFITPVYNFTDNTSEQGNCHWLYASPLAFSNAGTYTLPTTISLPVNGSFSADDTMYHYSVTGVSFADSDFTQTGTGIATAAKSNPGFTIYPDPSSGQFTLKLQGKPTNYTVEIYNVIGEKTYQSVLSNSQSVIDLSNQPDGMYFIYLKSDEGVEKGKAIITK